MNDIRGFNWPLLSMFLAGVAFWTLIACGVIAFFHAHPLCGQQVGVPLYRVQVLVLSVLN